MILPTISSTGLPVRKTDTKPSRLTQTFLCFGAVSDDLQQAIATAALTNKFFLAARTGNRSMIAHCLAMGIDVNIKSAGDEPKDGQTALMGACQNGDIGMVNYLLDNCADASIQDNSGKTALDYAKETTRFTEKDTEQTKLIQLLEQAKNNPPKSKNTNKGGPNKAGKKLLGRVRQILQSMLNQLRQFFNRLFRRG